MKQNSKNAHYGEYVGVDPESTAYWTSTKLSISTDKCFDLDAPQTSASNRECWYTHP